MDDPIVVGVLHGLGGAFGAQSNIRLSYATGDDKIFQGIERIGKALSKLK